MFFRLVQRPGLKRSHPFKPRGEKGGLVRADSEVLVEKNREMVEGKHRVPKR